MFKQLAQFLIGALTTSSKPVEEGSTPEHVRVSTLSSRGTPHNLFTPRGRRTPGGLIRLLLTGLLLGAASQAHAGTFYCQADYGGVIDGFDPATFNYVSTTNNTLGIDGSCTIKNWPQDNGIGGFPITNINYYFPGGADYYIVFDNVYYPGNMSCNDPNNSNFWIYWAPGSFNKISDNCQQFMVPVDMVVKTNPVAQTTASIGVPFTYTITAPKLGSWDVDTQTFNQVADSDTHADLENLVITDDLTQTGAALTYVTNQAYLVDTSTGTRTLLNGGAPLTEGASGTWLADHPSVTSDGTKHLVFSYENNPDLALVQSGYRIDIELTVVLDDVASNAPGTTFNNTSKMWFDKLIEYTRTDGTTGYTAMTNLQAWPITTADMTIAEPDLVVTKTSSTTTLNGGQTADFSVAVQNTGGATAWEASILDSFPAGMCDYFTTTGTGATALGIYAADGTTLLRSLSEGVDYNLTWTGDPTCELTLDMVSPDAAIAPTEQLILTYPGQLDSDVVDGSTHTNVAVAQQWYNNDAAPRKTYGPYTSSDGSETYADAVTITATLSGYFFKKTVTNLTTGAMPAVSAAAGDVLHYTLTLENFNIPSLTGVTITDDLGALNGADYIVPGSLTNVTNTLPAGATLNVNPNGGTNGAGLITASGFDLGTDEAYVIEFDVTVGSAADGDVIQNQADISGYDTGSAANLSGVSDDPYVGGPILLGTGGDITEVSVLTPGPLLKQNDVSTATIGKPFTYTLTIPETPLNVPLYDVEIHDTLSSGVAMHYVDATVLSGGTWSLTNVGTPTDLIIKDEVTGIDIPANGQVEIQIAVMLDNDAINQAGLTFNNTADYSYSRVNGSTDPQITPTGSTTEDMTVVEPDLTIAKSASFVSPATKVVGTDPATVGDVLEYTLTIPNTGSTAYDTSVVDDLPADVSYVAGSATASLDDGSTVTPISGFVPDPDPTALSGGTLILGNQNGDGSLDIPVGQTLIVTYQVTVEAAGTDLVNTVYADWKSWDGTSTDIRTGDGCPTITAPDDYCTGPATSTVATQDNTALSKQVYDDSYAETPASTGNPVVRVGDTVTYDLTLNLQDYTTQNVVVTDELPPGMAFEGYSILPSSATFNYTTPLAQEPSSGDIGTLTWDFDDIYNDPSTGGGAAVDQLVIRYTARVVTASAPTGVDTSPSNSLQNGAAITYTGSDPANTNLTDSTIIDVLQPQMSAITKVDLNGASRAGSGTSGDPYQVNIATDVMNFELESCNTGLAPAYGATLSDVLDPELDGSTLSTPVVSVGSTTLTAGSGYTYTYDSATQTMSFVLTTEVNPSECVTVDYNVGFDTTLATQSTWNNHAALTQYASLPASGRLYTLDPATDFAAVYMTNLVSTVPLSKSLVSPASEATIGDEVTYQIVVPGSPANVALNNVEVVDTLQGALEYVSASAVDSSNASVSLTDNTTGQDVSLGITQIPAGEQVTITLTTRVANNSSANAGDIVTNTAGYTYTGMTDPTQTQDSSGSLTIVEPELAIGKTVINTTNSGQAPVVGDILQYSVTFNASGGAAGDNFSDAYDLLIEDSLSSGLGYVTDSATVDGTGNTISNPTIVGDGSTSAPQTLTWSLATTTADIDVPEGSTVTVTYNVEVLSSATAGQALTNSATVQWTGQDGATYERDGSDPAGVDDYYAGPASATITSQFAVAFTKSVVNVTTTQDPGTNASPGDTLQYTLTISNQSVSILTNAAVVDELAAEFEPGTLNLISVSDGGADSSNTSNTGGANGTGIVDVSGITLAPQGTPGDTVTIVFEATLASVIQSGTTVLNVADITGDNLPATSSTQTSTLIGSAPQFEVWKSSQDLTGDATVLEPGDTLRYTITIQNVGNEDAINSVLSDLVPANTTYVANSTTLNGNSVSDIATGSPLQNGLPINAPGSASGVMPADPSGTNYVATVTFDVTINDVFDGTHIINQGYFNADGAGTSGPVSEEPTDDPSTTAQDNDATIDVVGNVPSVDAQKVVEIIDTAAGGTAGVLDTGDQLRYTITMTNNGTTPATNVVLSDSVPAGTSYVPGSVELNGISVSDVAGTSPLVTGLPVSSSDLTPPLPTAGNGTISPGETATVTFIVDVTAVSGDITNQGTVSLDQQIDEPTDFDGIDSNGDQPTVVTVNAAQQLDITKQAFIVGGGAALPGSTVEYLIRVTNTGAVSATDVIITDTIPGDLTYVSNSATMNGSTTGVDDTTTTLTADYATTYGDLAPGGVVTLRFRAQINAGLADGTEILNAADVEWNAASQSASASARLVVGGYYGTATLNGQIWHDTNYDNNIDSGELPLANWSVDLYRNGAFVGTTLTDISGNYTLTNIQPNDTSGDLLEIRFRAPGAGANTAALGHAYSGDSNSTVVLSDEPQRIAGITVAIGDNITELNLPIDPSGVVYNAVSRAPVAGARLTMLSGGAALDPSCFDDTAQQGQVTLASGYYKFDLNFSQASCQPGADYVIRVEPPASGYRDRISQYTLPPSSDASTAAYDVPSCSIASASGYCEALPTESAPAIGTATTYYLNLTLNDPQPTSSQLFNNHIPLDPILNEAVAITKTSSRVNVSRSEMVPYTITVNNSYLTTLQNLTIVDTFPAGFKYVKGSSRFDGQPLEPTTVGTQLRWENINLATDVQHTIQMVFIVGSGVSEGEYVNRAQVISSQTADAVSAQASATVRVVPDPTFDCTDIIGKVYDDKNLNGAQDDGEPGLPGARVVTARGLKITSDEYGRFHITCAAVPDENRGSNFILKVDERSLPTGYRVTTENPRVERLTRGKMAKFNFGATIHHVVRMDVADGVFEPDSTEMRSQWKPRIGLLLEELKKSPSVLHISYLADVEDEGLVRKRVAALKEMIADKWDDLECCYQLTIETEVYWRRGAPPKHSGILD